MKLWRRTIHPDGVEDDECGEWTEYELRYNSPLTPIITHPDVVQVEVIVSDGSREQWRKEKDSER